MRTGTAEEPGGAAGSPGYALWVGPALALLMYWPTLTGTFLSDDFLVNTMLLHDDTLGVNWSEVFADFTRSWAGLEGSDLYRPLVSVSFAATYALGGMDPLLFHSTNVAIHVLATLACARLCVACSPQRPVFAALLGGVLFAVHPVAAEPTCWIASRTTGMQVMFGLWAMACFASFIGSGRRSQLFSCVGFFTLSLLCKESAVLLPLSFVALDLLIRGRGPRPSWIRLHAIMLSVVVAYFALRMAVLGVLLGGSSDGVRMIQSADLLANLGGKLGVLFAPVGNGLVEPWGYLLGAITMLVLAVTILSGLRAPATRTLTVFGMVWIAAYFAPTWRMAMTPETLGGSRMAYGALGVFAIYVTAIASRTSGIRPELAKPARFPLPVALVALLIGLAALGWARMLQYQGAYQDMRDLQTSLAEVARDANEETPLVMVSIAAPPSGIPFLNCNALFPLAELPVAGRDTPTVGMGFVWQPVPESEHLLFDVGPMRAMREQGGLLLDWNRVDHVFHVDRRTPGAAPPLPQLQPGKNGQFITANPLDPWAVEALEIEVKGACSGGEVAWLYMSTGGPRENVVTDLPAYVRRAPLTAEFESRQRRGDHTVFYVDLSHHLTFLALRLLGGFAGVRVTLDRTGDAPEGEVVAVRLLPRVDLVDLPKPLRGATIRLDGGAIEAPRLPDGANRLVLYLVGPDTTLHTEVVPGPVQLPRPLQTTIRKIMRSSRQKRYYYYFEAHGTRSWRSPVDWVVFH